MDSNITIDHQPEIDTGTALALIPAASLPAILAADSGGIFAAIAAKVAAFKPDASTDKGRAAIRTMAAEVATAKMDLIRLAKGLTEGWRASTKAVNAECNVIEEKFDALKVAVRQKLTDYEQIEKTRCEGHEAAIAQIKALATLPEDATASDIAGLIVAFSKSDILDRDWLEFGPRAKEAATNTLNAMKAAHADAVAAEAAAEKIEKLRLAEIERQRIASHEAALDAIPEHTDFGATETSADLARRLRHLRAYPDRNWEEFAGRASDVLTAEIERTQTLLEAAQAREAEAQRQHDAKVAVEAAALATQEAEARATREAAAQAAAVEAERLAAAKRELAALDAAARAKAAAEQAETDRIAAAAKAEQEMQAAKLAAEKRQADAVEAERLRASQAAAAEAQRVADAAEATRKADAARAANIAHRRKINNEALQDLCGAANLTSDQAQAAVAAIAAGRVRHLGVTY